MPEYRKIKFNPADVTQALALTSDGRLIPFGSVLDPNVDMGWDGTDGVWDVARDLQVINWATPSGYILDGWGGIHPFGGATAPSVNLPPYFPGQDVMRGIVMDPAGNGQGYAIHSNGTIYRFGSALPTALSASPSLAGVGVRDFVMDWTTRKWFVLDGWGGLFPGGPSPGTAAVAAAGYSFYQRGWDIARALHVFGWGATSDLAVLDGWGGIHKTTGAPATSALPYWQGWDIARDIHWATTSPSDYRVFDGHGVIHRVQATTAPTVTVGVQPATPITTTTRPTIFWTAYDVELDPIDRVEVKIFTAAQYGIGGFDAATSPNTYSVVIDELDPDVAGLRNRYHQVTADLANATYRAYVRVRERGSGLFSAWATSDFVQNVTAFAAPTLAVLAVPGDARIQLTATIGGVPAGATMIEFEVSYNAGVTWLPVRSGKVAAGTNVVVSDYEAPFNVATQYRARFYTGDAPTGTYRGGTWSATQSTTLSITRYWISIPETVASRSAVTITDLSWDRPVASSGHTIIGQRERVVISDTYAVKSRTGRASLVALNAADELFLETILAQDRAALVRDVHGHRYFVKVDGSVGTTPRRATKLISETAPVRQLTAYELGLTEVARPAVA